MCMVLLIIKYPLASVVAQDVQNACRPHGKMQGAKKGHRILVLIASWSMLTFFDRSEDELGEEQSRPEDANS